MPQADLATFYTIVTGEFFCILTIFSIIKLHPLFLAVNNLKVFNKYKHKNIIFYI